MSKSVYIGELEDIPRRGARKVEALGCDIAIFRTGEDELFALEDKCPHKQGPLSDGIVQGRGVACPLHNWIIDLGSGLARGPDEGCVKRFAVELRGSAVYLGPLIGNEAAPEANLAVEAE